MVIASWDVSGQSSYGTSPLAAAADPNVTVGGLTRGSGVTTTPTAAARGWGGNGFTATTAAAAVTANTYATFTVTPKTGYTTSFTSLSKFDYRRSASGATNGVFQYQVGSGAFVDVATLSYSSSASAGASIGPIDLSTISALQNIAAGTVVTFRIVSYGATSATGTWYVFDVSNSTAADLALTGIVNPVVAGTPDLTLAKTHTGSFTQGDTGKAYTLTVTNAGTASTSGTVTVTDTLPSGLTATAFSGTGWTTNLSTLTATRSDGLAQGSSYPPLTLTVSVSQTAAASVTNIASISGGGETNTANDSASDITTIVPLTPIQTWRNQWFGNSANSGAGLDTAIAAGDGIPNLLKYALNLTPPQTPATTNGVVVVDSNAGALRLTITKNPAANDLIFSIEGTTNLADPNSWSTTNIVIDQNTSTTLQAHDSSLLTGSPHVLRLKVTRP